MKTRVIVADDTRASLEALRALLKSTCEIVSKASDGDSALKLIREFKPDVAVLDMAMPGLNGIEVTRKAILEQPTLGVVICTITQDPAIIQEAVEAGARGYVFKVNLVSDLARAVHAVAAGGTFLPGSNRIATHRCNQRQEKAISV